MKRIGFVLFVALTHWVYAGEEEQWLSFDAGLQQANKTEKIVLVDFYTDWCRWCKEMDKKTFQNPQVSHKLENDFITVRLNAEDKESVAHYKGEKYSNVELTRLFGVRGFPTLAFLRPSGDLITLIPGFVPPDTFIPILDYIENECYDKGVSFEEYLERGDCHPDTSDKS
jgi:thioredoxin-related protein